MRIIGAPLVRSGLYSSVLTLWCLANVNATMPRSWRAIGGDAEIASLSTSSNQFEIEIGVKTSSRVCTVWRARARWPTFALSRNAVGAVFVGDETRKKNAPRNAARYL